MAKKAQGVPTDNLSVLTPCPVFTLAPYFDLALETSTRSPSCLLFARSHQVVYAERMCLVKSLYNWKVGFRSVVDIDATRARSREQLCTSRRYSEDVARFGMGRLDRVEGKVLF